MTFSVALRVIAADGSTERLDLNDRAAGYELKNPFVTPEAPLLQATYESPRSNGDFTSGPPRDGVAAVPVLVEVTGGTWAEVETRYEALRTAVRAEPEFFAELEREGVTRRWRTRRPMVAVVDESLVLNRMRVQVTFAFQPNPTVEVAP